MSGNKRGKYDVSKATKNQDEVEFVSYAFKGKVNVGGEDFLLLVGGGRIPAKYEELYLYVKYAKVPEAWAKAFVDSQILSAVKIEAVKKTSH